MKILYGIQGTGNGHVSRARTIVPILEKIAAVEVLISGSAYNVVPDFKVNYKMKGLDLAIHSRGGVSITKTVLNSNLPRLLFDILKFDINTYDLVISDFEPVSAWAAKITKVPSIALGHQAAFKYDECPRPEHKLKSGERILSSYCPADKHIGFHFQQYHKNILCPVIPEELKRLHPTPGEHISVYLPAFSNNWLRKYFSEFREQKWEVFSSQTKMPYNYRNVDFYPIQTNKWHQSIASCKAAIIGAGFEGPAELLHLRKPFMVMPIKNHYEQLCNSSALDSMGIPVIYDLGTQEFRKIKSWLNNPPVIDIQMTDPINQLEIKLNDIITDLGTNYVSDYNFI